MCERVTVVTLSVSHFLILEKVPFSEFNLHQYNLSDDLSHLNVAFF